MPDASAVRQTLAAGQHDLSIASTDALGNYRVRAGGEQDKLDRGFSVNLSPDVTRLDRVNAKDLANTLGAERTRVARTQGEIEVRVGVGRVGYELFPALILAVALVMAAEQLLANRFYDSAEPSAIRSHALRGNGLWRRAASNSPGVGNTVGGAHPAPEEAPTAS